MKITKSYSPSNSADWWKWLEQNHDREQEVWLVYVKAGRGQTTIDYESSVEEALCFGWVDSIIQKIDEETYARKFNPRRMDSKWSETNKRRVLKVIREGRMTEAGLAKVTFDVNEVDTRTRKLKPKRAPVQMPEKMEQVLKSRPGLWEAFQKLSPSYRRNYILWLSDAKKPETFERRLQILIKEVMAGKPTSMH
jgi:uncharacterized protein YdeI (YjbR/CyaY-like superfamily)